MELKLVNRVVRQISEQQRSKLSKAWFEVKVAQASVEVKQKKVYRVFRTSPASRDSNVS
jgi:hypothetical protein